jgi:predicted chitinase
MNTTDAGSGKRVLISPFDIGSNSKESDLCILSNKPDHQKDTSTSLHFNLSTAAFISARFPWVTPAATVTIKNDCITKNSEARLVDGGYIDNSGVETALNMIDAIQSNIDQTLARKIKICHISLAGGDFPDHGAFSFDDLMEPIRALLSSRTSRAYIALNRAQLRAQRNDPNDVPSTFSRVDLQNYFYALPLGWELSEKTQDIISLDSGRFWDCHPNKELAQSAPHLSKADCEIMQVYHLLNNSIRAALSEYEDQETTQRYLAPIVGPKRASASLTKNEPILACYERNWIQKRAKEFYDQRLSQRPQQEVAPYRQRYLANFQGEYVRALLNEWDSQGERNRNVLAYLLGSISYDSEDFSRTTENLSFRTEAQIPASWKTRIAKFNDLNKRKTPPGPEVRLSDLLNNPTALANAVWGPPLEGFGNTHPNDGWTYRSRGIYQIVGRDQYSLINDRYLPKQFPDLKLDILTYPDSVWDPIVSAKVAIAHFFQHQYNGQTLVQMAKASTDWEKIRSLQTDMDQINPKEVSDRVNMFLECIGEAEQPPSLVRRYIRTAQRVSWKLAGFH